MIRLGWAFTAYVCLSFILFLVVSNTIPGFIFYFLLLLPFYVLTTALWWVFVWQNRTKVGQINYWVWSVVIGLQIATLLASPGNCYGFKQGSSCYSNLQILLGGVAQNTPSQLPHWPFVESAFPFLLIIYGISIIFGLSSVFVKRRY
jgi:hypothetical protein